MILDSRGAEVNGNGVDMTERQRAKYMLQMATIGEVNEIAHAHAVQAMNHLGNQVPALLKKMIEEAVTAALNGYHQSLVERGVIQSGDSGALAEAERAAERAADENWNYEGAINPPADISSLPETPGGDERAMMAGLDRDDFPARSTAVTFGLGSTVGAMIPDGQT